MIIYEVNVEVDADIADAYVDWLFGHVRDVGRSAGFLGADLFVVESESPSRTFCIRYRVADSEAFKSYLANSAESMRSEGVQRFGDRFRASRRVMAHVKRFR